MPNREPVETPAGAPAEGKSLRLGDRLIEAGLITRSELDSTLEWLRENGLSKRRLGRTLVELGFVNDRELTKILGVHFAMPVAPFPVFDAEQAAINVVPAEFARRHRLIPCRLANGSLSVAAPSPVKADVVNELARLTRHSITVYLASEREVETGLSKFYPETTAPVAAPPAGAEKPAASPGVSTATRPDAPSPVDAKPAQAEKPAPVSQSAPAKSTPMSESTRVQPAVSPIPSDMRERAQHYAAQTHEFATALQRIITDNERLTVDAGHLEQECQNLREDNARLRQEADRAREDNARVCQDVERLRQEKEQVLAAVQQFAQETLTQHGLKG